MQSGDELAKKIKIINLYNVTLNLKINYDVNLDEVHRVLGSSFVEKLNNKDYMDNLMRILDEKIKLEKV